MAKRIGIHPSFTNPIAVRRSVASGAVGSIDRGAPAKEGSGGAVAIMVDGDGTTSQRFSGIAKSVSTDTASVAGAVELYLPVPSLVYVGKPKVVGAADTQTEIDALGGKRVVFDLTTGDWTIDSAAVDGATNGIVIIGGSIADDALYFLVSPTCTVIE